MIINHPNLMCVGVNPPREWEMNGQKGVTYKVQVSDGTQAIEIKCASVDVWQIFKAFKNFSVNFEITQSSNAGRMGIRAQIVGAQPVKA